MFGFGSKNKNKKTAQENQRILNNVMEWIDEEKEKNMKIFDAKGSDWQNAEKKINWVREIYKKMNS